MQSEIAAFRTISESLFRYTRIRSMIAAWLAAQRSALYRSTCPSARQRPCTPSTPTGLGSVRIWVSRMDWKAESGLNLSATPSTRAADTRVDSSLAEISCSMLYASPRHVQRRYVGEFGAGGGLDAIADLQ